MAASLVIVIATGSGATVTDASRNDLGWTAAQVGMAAPVKCPSVKKALRYYTGRYRHWTQLRGAVTRPMPAALTSCPRYLTSVRRVKAYVARTRAERWIAEHVLTDYRVAAGAQAWRRAVQEAQKPYPGTTAWLLSCSASEGGHGRWVPNSQGSGVGGWLQFHPSTFSGFLWHARVNAARRGYIVPASAASWYSPLGQALAGAWGITHGMRHHWAGRGCW